MAIKGNDVALFLSGQPVLVKECNIVISQPKIKQIVMLGEEEFLSAAQILGNIEKIVKPIKEGNPELEKYSDFQILLILAIQDEGFKKNLNILFELIFPLYSVEVTENNILFKSIEDENKVLGMINPFNFLTFSSTIKKLFLSKNSKEIEYNPGDEAARKIAEKIQEGRDKIAKMKAKKNEDSSLFGTYISILSVGMNINMNEFFEYTPFQLYDTFSRYWLKVQSDFYSRVSTMPMMDVSKMEKPEEWSKNLY